PGLVALRRGFHAHDYLAENEPAWLDLLNQSAEFGAWDATRLREEIVYHLLPGGAVLVSGRSEMVACAAVCDFPADAPLATLMYVVVLPEYRGHGLGKYVTAAAINRAFMAGYSGITLRTDDHRIPAITTYLDLGLKPQIRAGTTDNERWDKVLTR